MNSTSKIKTVLFLIMITLFASHAYGYPLTEGEVYTERFAYEGIITKYADSDLFNQIGDPFKVNNQDVAIYSDNHFQSRSVITGSYWYDYDYLYYGKEWYEVITPGFMQYWDEGQFYVTNQKYSFDGFDGQYWTEFNLNLSIENAPYWGDAFSGDAYSTLYFDNDFQTGFFHTLNLGMTVTGLQGGNSPWDEGWILAEEVEKSPEGVTGFISGVFEGYNGHFYTLDFTLNMDSWAHDTYDGNIYQGYYHARPVSVPEPSTWLLLGTGILILLALGRQKMLERA